MADTLCPPAPYANPLLARRYARTWAVSITARRHETSPGKDEGPVQAASYF